MKTWIKDGTVDRDSWVWKTGWLDWQRASDVFPELGAVLEAAPLSRPKSFVEESLVIKTDERLSLPNDPDAVSMHKRRQRQKREQIKSMTLFLGGMIFLLLIVMLVVLLR
jgi:hypothetical protein